MATPAKESQPPRRHARESPKPSENLDPNLLPVCTPRRSQTRSPAIKPSRSKNPALKTPVRMLSPSPSPAKVKCPVTPKKKTSIAPPKGLDSDKCHQEAAGISNGKKNSNMPNGSEQSVVEDLEVKCPVTPKKKASIAPSKGLDSNKCHQEAAGISNGNKNSNLPNGGEQSVVKNLEGSVKTRTMRRLMLEEAMSGLPEQGAGRVMYLVKTFERLLSISKETDGESEGEVKRKMMNLALPGLQQAVVSKISSPVSSLTDFLAGEDFGRDSAGHSSVNSKGNRSSCGSNESNEGRRNRQNSTGSSGRSRSKRLKVKSLQPFKLRTEQRGRFKEEQFIKKVKEMLLEEEKQRTPIAQGLPWTTDEPEIPIKPTIKEPTEPIDLILHSDVRAVERAQFDLHVAERMNFIEQIKMERERQQKLEEEKEIRRLRRELVPKAQPMPCFDQPFIPKKSKPRTVPKEPRYHIHRLKGINDV